MDLNLPWDQYSWFLFKGDVPEENRLTFLVARITHYISLSIVLAGILVMVIRALMGMNSSYETSDIAMFFLMVALGFGIIVIDGFFIKILGFICPMGTTGLAVLAYRSVQKLLFLLPAIIGLLLVVTTSETWYVVIPLYIGSGVALIWTFPTQARWEKWLRPRPGSIYPDV